MSLKIKKDFREVKKIELKSLPGGELEIYSGTLFKDSHIFNDLVNKPYDPMTFLKSICLCIHSWNFVGEDDKELPVCEESLAMIKPEAIHELSQAIIAFAQEKKNP